MSLRALTTAVLMAFAAFASDVIGAGPFTPGNLVISVYGSVDAGRVYEDNQATPITLVEITPNGSTIGSITLPQTASVRHGQANQPISGEYGSSSEGILQLTNDGRYLVIAGYGVAADTFNAAASSFGGETKHCGVARRRCYALAQTSSATLSAFAMAQGANRIVVPRVIALIAGDGRVDTSTALTNVFDRDNPRSAASVDGRSLYMAGQGKTIDGKPTGGLFVAKRGAEHATAIDSSADARVVSIQTQRLFVSTDASKADLTPASIRAYGSQSGLPVALGRPQTLPGMENPYLPTSSSALNALGADIHRRRVYLSPESYFFANATTLYVADSGRIRHRKGNVSDETRIGSNGGLQKWRFDGRRWTLTYTLSDGLLDFHVDSSICEARNACGTTGLIGLTGRVIGDEDKAQLFTTNATRDVEGKTYLYRVDDIISANASQGQKFSVARMAESNTIIRGVAFAPSVQ